jgi:hypothetical protein
MSQPRFLNIAHRAQKFFSRTGENTMNGVKINEDWLATILAFLLIVLALIGVIGPWMKF